MAEDKQPKPWDKNQFYKPTHWYQKILFYPLVEKVFSIATLVWPFFELHMHFGDRMYMLGNAQTVNPLGYVLWINHFRFWTVAYWKTFYFWMALNIGLFIASTRERTYMGVKARYNMVQHTLFNMLIACGGGVFSFFPAFWKSNFIFVYSSKFFYITMMCWMFMSIINILLDRYTVIPIVTDAVLIYVRVNYNWKAEFERFAKEDQEREAQEVIEDNSLFDESLDLDELMIDSFDDNDKGSP